MGGYSVHTDSELVTLLKQRDHAAFTEIYTRYWTLLYIHSKKLLRDKDEAMDVVQDIFTALWNNSSDFELNGPLKPYLYTAVRNRVIKLINRGKLQVNFTTEMVQVMTELVPYTDEQVSYKELERILEKEISKLNPKMQAIFDKSKNLGMSQKAIAEELNISEATVKTTLFRTMSILREKISGLLTLAILLAKIKNF